MVEPRYEKDLEVLKPLLDRYAEIAGLPVQKKKTEMWTRLNRLEPERPLVWINEIPWHEMNIDGELLCRCTEPYLRTVETYLRQTIYQWNHMPCDMVVDPILYVDYVCSPTSTYADYGIQEKPLYPDGSGSVLYQCVINSEDDADKIRTPQVTVDWDETERRFLLLKDVAGDTLAVEKRGIVHQWASPWDQMVHWYGVEQLYLDMIDRPALVHRLLSKFMDAVNEVLDKQEAMGLLSVSSGNHRVGSGGLGITDELPQPDFDPCHVTPRDQWGTSTGQIFSSVSPAMHDEFCLQYEQPYMERFGLSCYGCCEPLHNKMSILRRVRNLRRISMSYWIDLPKAVAEVGRDYIFSYKPTPAYFAADSWDPAPARENLQQVLKATDECRVEIIMKDISTVRKDPKRLWEWAHMAMAMVESS